MSYNDSDDLSYNPFADQSSDHSYSGGSNLVQAHYSSAYIPKVSLSPPSLRRRRSASTGYGQSKINGQRGKHARTQTDIQVNAANSTGLHPLKSALAKIDSSSAEELGNTRPTLSRIVNEGSLGSIFASEDDVNSRTVDSLEEEKDVIIHQISSKDSLPGVALKYGITMTNLRRANRLWTSDSIHRREALYIPVDEASRAAEYISDSPLITLTPNEPSSSTSTPPRATSVSTAERENSEPILRSPSVPVRRIPTSQLSYFPPSLHKNTSSLILGHTSSPSPSHAEGAKPLHNWYNSSPANNSFTSILTALPIAASTRDELITRLSFDSVSSSFSDRSRTSRRNSDEDDGHELNEVIRAHDDDNADPFDGFAMPTPKASHRVSHALPTVKKPSNTLSVPHSQTTYQRQYSSMSPPQFYVSQANEAYVRTSQLEPSPAMKLPSFSSRSTGRSSGKTLQDNARLERISSLPVRPHSKTHLPNGSTHTVENAP